MEGKNKLEYQLLGVSGLILIILVLTWLKDDEHMPAKTARNGG